jgi:hypothetical protein
MSSSKETKETAPETVKTNIKEFEKILEDMNTFIYCKTNILNDVKFTTPQDKDIFNALPLTNSQKENLLLSIYQT